MTTAEVQARVEKTSAANYLVWRFFNGEADLCELVAYCYKAVRHRRLYIGSDLEQSGTWDAVGGAVLRYMEKFYRGESEEEIAHGRWRPETLAHVEELALRDEFRWVAHFVIHRIIDQVRRKQAALRLAQLPPRQVRKSYFFFTAADEVLLHNHLNARLAKSLHASVDASSKGDETRRICEARGISPQQARADKRALRAVLRSIAAGSGKRVPGRSAYHKPESTH